MKVDYLGPIRAAISSIGNAYWGNMLDPTPRAPGIVFNAR